MENAPNLLNNQKPAPPPAPGSSRRYLWKVILSVIVIAACYLAAAYYYSLWPFGPAVPDYVEAPSDWKIYRNEKYHFEFIYPKDWVFEEETEGSIPGFFARKGDNHFAVLPKGGFEYTRAGTPMFKNIYINYEAAKRQNYTGSFTVEFYQTPPEWENHRIDAKFDSKETEDKINEILRTFVFIR